MPVGWLINTQRALQSLLPGDPSIYPDDFETSTCANHSWKHGLSIPITARSLEYGLRTIHPTTTLEVKNGIGFRIASIPGNPSLGSWSLVIKGSYGQITATGSLCTTQQRFTGREDIDGQMALLNAQLAHVIRTRRTWWPRRGTGAGVIHDGDRDRRWDERGSSMAGRCGGAYVTLVALVVTTTGGGPGLGGRRVLHTALFPSSHCLVVQCGSGGVVGGFRGVRWPEARLEQLAAKPPEHHLKPQAVA